MKKLFLSISITAALLAAFAGCSPKESPFFTGKGVITYYCEEPMSHKSVDIQYYIPEGDVSKMPVQFVIHGMDRNGDNYRDSWIDFADRYGCVVLVPTFDKDQFPERAYQLGNIKDSEDAPEFNAQDTLTYKIIGQVFRFFVRNTASKAKTFNIYGHSAGGQFIHRYLIFDEAKEVGKAVAANAGWYTVPTDTIDFPYGLGKGLEFYGLDKKQYYARDLTILLGTADTLRTSSLRQSPEADLQGLTRLARGQYFYNYCKQDAANMGVPFNWKLEFVEGSGHSNWKMAPGGAEVIYGNKE